MRVPRAFLRILSVVPLLGLLFACRGPALPLTLDGRPLVRAPLSAERCAELEARLAEARARFEADPTDEDAIVWLGRRTAYLGRHDEAIAIYTRGLALHPDSQRLLRHRGHRYISTRRLERAIRDLERAASLSADRPNAVEEDGLPNAAGVPIGTTHGNIWYHLGLARYLAGDFEGALAAWEARAALDANDDNRCATAYWRYLCLARTGRAARAAEALEGITPGMELLENFAYHELLLLFKGVRSPADLVPPGDDGVADATLGYGLSMWLLFAGREEEARAHWQRMVREPEGADAFGRIAAEAELARGA